MTPQEISGIPYATQHTQSDYTHILNVELVRPKSQGGRVIMNVSARSFDEAIEAAVKIKSNGIFNPINIETMNAMGAVIEVVRELELYKLTSARLNGEGRAPDATGMEEVDAWGAF